MDPRVWINNSLQDAQPWKVVAGSVVGTAAAIGGYYLYNSGDVSGTLGRAAFKALRAVPGADSLIDKEVQTLMGKLEDSMFKENDDSLPRYFRIPEKGVAEEELLEMMKKLAVDEEKKWSSGQVSGGVYHGMQEHLDVVNKAYALNALSNPLHPDVFPSATKYESEIVAMTIHMLGGTPGKHVGNVTSGGTESILMAMKAVRDYSRHKMSHVTVPEVIVPSTAHAAFDKAAHYFGMRLVKIPLAKDWRADVAAVRRAINRNTVMLVGSAPSFPHGMVDPIEELAELARSRGLFLHVDACLGGFLLPWLRKIGHPGIPAWDFSVPGVSTISADTHKYGYAVKGTSVLSFSDATLRRYMYFVAPEWSGGIYATPTICGSRAGGLVAACWASLVHMGEEGYCNAAKKISETTLRFKKEIAAMPELELVGDSPTMVVAFRANDDLTSKDSAFVYKLLEGMSRKGWSLNALQYPSCLHICVTYPVAQHADEFLSDLRNTTVQVCANPKDFNDGMAPVYGMAVSLPDKSLVTDMTSGFLDLLTKPRCDKNHKNVPTAADA